LGEAKRRQAAAKVSAADLSPIGEKSIDELAAYDWRPDKFEIPGLLNSMRSARQVRGVLKIVAELLELDRATLTAKLEKMRRKGKDETPLRELIKAARDYHSLHAAAFVEALTRLDAAAARLQLNQRKE